MMKKEMPDRRVSTDRRSARRFTVTIEIVWEYLGERHPGTISDLSEGGCFVLTGIDVNDNDEVGVFLPIGEGMKVQYIGTITNHFDEIGFAARFTRLSEAQRNVLRSYLLGEEEAKAD
ncbi:MAG: PilZ domain-containing protein [bacterium]|nr:PilZ domain-containing protein [bacterium]